MNIDNFTKLEITLLCKKLSKLLEATEQPDHQGRSDTQTIYSVQHVDLTLGDLRRAKRIKQQLLEVENNEKS